MFAVLLLMTALVQATFLSTMNLIDIVPDLALVLLLIWSSTRGVGEGMIWAVALGLWVDLLTMEPLGTHALALLIVGIIGGLMQGRLFRSGVLLPTAAVSGATLVYSMVTFVLTSVGSGGVALAGMARFSVLSALINALLVPVVYVFLLACDRWVPRHVRV